MSIPHRSISLDTETTGVNPEDGDRIVEIGAVEMIDGLATERELHLYMNPCRAMPKEAFDIHGLSSEFLRDKPIFDHVVDEFMAFIGDAPLVIHNAAFDMRFLNAELRRSGRPPLADDRAIDTLDLARRRFPGSAASLDALCRRFGIDNTHREKHGALLDARLLAAVYIELAGGRQRKLDLNFATSSLQMTQRMPMTSRTVPEPLLPTQAERDAHASLLVSMKNPIWLAA